MVSCNPAEGIPTLRLGLSWRNHVGNHTYDSRSDRARREQKYHYDTWYEHFGKYAKHNKMKKFKTPLLISGTNEQLNNIQKSLEELGYRYIIPDRKDETYTWLVTKVYESADSNTMSRVPSPDRHYATQVPASNPDLVLALAAMVEGDKIYKGEWLQQVDYPQVMSMAAADAPPNSAYGVDVIGADGRALRVPLRFLRKATAGEIMQRFRNLRQDQCYGTLTTGTLTTGTLTGCDNRQTERQWIVKESFIKSAHAAACGDWKKKIEHELPELFPKPVVFKLGDKVRSKHTSAQGRVFYTDGQVGVVGDNGLTQFLYPALHAMLGTNCDISTADYPSFSEYEKA